MEGCGEVTALPFQSRRMAPRDALRRRPGEAIMAKGFHEGISK